MNFKDMNISTRLTWAFGLMVSLILLLGGVTLSKEGVMQNSLTDVVERRLKIAIDLGKVRNEINVQARATRNMVLVRQPEAVKKEMERIQTSGKTVGELLDRVGERVLSEQGREIHARTVKLRDQYREMGDNFTGMVTSGRRDEAIDLLMERVRPVQDAYLATIGEQTRYQIENLQSSAAAAEDAARSIQITV